MRHLVFSMFSAALAIQACAAPQTPTAEAPVPPPRLLSATLDGPGLAVGSAAPDFEARAHDGRTVRLSDLRGREVILFFYTQDETPQSTREAMDLRDEHTQLAAQGAFVIGVSHDSLDTHVKFAKAHRLPYPLLSDDQGELSRAYGVPRDYGINDRQTFVVGKDGNLARIYRKVDVPRHAAEVLADVSDGSAP